MLFYRQLFDPDEFINNAEIILSRTLKCNEQVILCGDFYINFDQSVNNLLPSHPGAPYLSVWRCRSG